MWATEKLALDFKYFPFKVGWEEGSVFKQGFDKKSAICIRWALREHTVNLRSSQWAWGCFQWCCPLFLEKAHFPSSVGKHCKSHIMKHNQRSKWQCRLQWQCFKKNYPNNPTLPFSMTCGGEQMPWVGTWPLWNAAKASHLPEEPWELFPGDVSVLIRTLLKRHLTGEWK